jgi:hypothetical protein
MSDRSKTAISWVAVIGLSFSILGGCWVVASTLLSGGEILHEIKGLREDVTEIKASVNADRMETRKTLSEIISDQRKLERRVEVLEIFDSRHANGYERAK